MGNKGGKKGPSKELTPKRMFFVSCANFSILILYFLEIAMLRANTHYTERGMKIYY